jgi:hypothetical protein
LAAAAEEAAVEAVGRRRVPLEAAHATKEESNP